ncbi:MAG: hypothetical protein QOC98_1253, partial [Frankiaceae bacterium]|nr:hypothetical protein [Frankiaceae bacterium]
YLAQVQRGEIVCRPGIARMDGRTVTFIDGSFEIVDVLICATGYAVDVPYLSDDVRRILGPGLALHVRTLSPQLPGLAVLGQFALQGPYFPLLELQARWAVGVWSGTVPAPPHDAMTASIRTPAPPIDSHHVLALALAEQAGVTPEIAGRPELAELLLNGPMLPVRYRLDGPGAWSNAAELLVALAATP